MTIQEAIKKAIDGEWSGLSLGNGRWIGCNVLNPNTWDEEHRAEILLDPSFWQSLGKALGWGNNGITLVKYKFIESMERPTRGNPLPPLERNVYENKCEAWQYHQHRFIDHLADGGIAESYFAAIQDTKR